ncbi:molybdenum ABC transporter ATP-binding protein [Nitrospirillum sp. BR 11828]|uniref:molybdenum ABC transporter ATP-binding protein n=1 Tax=Nitrospirillum sp. BR 11828 TaxID=3104325 RepID=UPI002ACA392B|nr:molybdenum ABC transporter ATP-binding protein [Nitrospirillum sp. BR 11828]MDZ5649100.1 molybdenum ABC transporter ATP-binding protein [Nitrospirillum sp. BR 11828]
MGQAAAALDLDIALRQGTFQVEAKITAGPGLTVLFGPSGSGKSTLVDLVAGLKRPDRGRIAVDGVPLVDTAASLWLPPHRRRVGYVFQEARLLPHLTVRQNLLYGRWFARRHLAPDSPTCDSVADLLGIAPLLNRRPAALSGGEKARVALGRALLALPRILLMDEPLAALDEARKAEILPYLERLRDHAGLPILYVTHAVAEVARLATTVVMMDQGRVRAIGTPSTLWSRPDLMDLTGGTEAGALLDAVVGLANGDGLFALDTPAGRILVPHLPAHLGPGSRTRLRIPARDVLLSDRPPQGLSALNVLPGMVDDVREDADGSRVVRLDCGGASLLARVTRTSATALAIAPGQPLWAIVKAVALDQGS